MTNEPPGIVFIPGACAFIVSAADIYFSGSNFGSARCSFSTVFAGPSSDAFRGPLQHEPQ
jgi:hypothetical protein